MSDPKTVLPSSATRLAKAVDRALARQLDALPLPVRDAWDADKVSLDILPWMAWGVGKRTWSTEWPEATRRALVRTAIPTARRMGSVQSVNDVLAAFGGALTIREWWEMSPPGPPFTFSVVLNLNGATGDTVTARYVEEVAEEIRWVKPARAHFNVAQSIQATGDLAIVGAARAASAIRLDVSEAPPVSWAGVLLTEDGEPLFTEGGDRLETE